MLWEEGTPHHPKSKEIRQFINDNDSNGLIPFGGDGDLGEDILYYLDVYFTSEQSQPDKDEEYRKNKTNCLLTLLATIYEDKEWENLCHKQKNVVVCLCDLGYLSTGMHGFVGSAIE